MSKFVQKTLHSLNSVLNNSGIFYTERDKLLNTRSLNISAFQDKVRNAHTKQEEEEFINQYLARIEKRLSEPDVSCAEVEEMVKLCMVCETMGYKCEFIYVHSLKLAQKGNFQQKHTGYLAAEFFLHSHHELVILLINTIQKDLSSSNHTEVILALTVVCHLINNETVHNVLHLVEDKLLHSAPSVRKAAVLSLSHCLHLADSESAYLMALPKLEKCLSDPELEVVSAAVPAVHKIIQRVPGDFSYLLDWLLQLLDQVLMRRIPHSMHYSDIPAPWLQVDILRLLKHLLFSSTATPPRGSEKLIPILKKTLAQTGLYHAIAQAVVCQVLETIACIEADAELLEAAVSSVSVLLKSRDINMKFMGLEALVLIVKKIEPNITATQQDVIIDCLKLPDESLQLKTLELMYHLANAANVVALCRKMAEFLQQIRDDRKKKDLADRILHLAQEYRSRHQWYISVVLSVLVKVDRLMTSEDICRIVTVLASDEELKRIAKQDLKRHLEEEGLSSASPLKIYVSLLSEPSGFGPLLPLLETADDEDAVSWFAVSLTECLLRHKDHRQPLPLEECTHAVSRLEDRFRHSYALQIILKQLSQIIQHIADIPAMDNAQKLDASLTSLDSYVLGFLEDESVVCCPYEPLSLRMTSTEPPPPVTPPNCNQDVGFCVVVGGSASGEGGSSFTLKSPDYSTFSSPSSVSFQSLSSEAELSSPTVKKKNVWTKDGRSKNAPVRLGETSEKEIKEEEELLQLFAGVT